MTMKPTIGRQVWYRTDGRNGLVYDLPAIITVTKDSHPGDYPDGRQNPLPVPEDDFMVHLTVFTPGGYGSFIPKGESSTTKIPAGQIRAHDSSEFIGAASFVPGSGSYVEWNVPIWTGFESEGPFDIGDERVGARSWRWPVIK